MTTKEVYKKYEHLDHLLSDEEWLEPTIQGKIIFDLWGAIRSSIEEEEKDMLEAIRSMDELQG